MSELFKIVPLPNGDFCAEKLVVSDQATTYESATFRTMREAREWVERQGRPPRPRRIDYFITATENGAHRVTLVRTDREAPETLGEFATADDANEFVRRMRQLDDGPTHGGGDREG